MAHINNSNNDEVIPINFHLSQNYPNPFKEKTTIKYCVAYKTRVRITVFNSNGETIENLLDEEKEAGTYEIEFDVKKASSGELRTLLESTYIYQLKAGNYCNKKEMTFKF